MTSFFPRLAVVALALAATIATASAQGVSTTRVSTTGVSTSAAPTPGVSTSMSRVAPRGIPGSSEQQSIKGMNPAPTATLLGTPVVVNTPVLSPNNSDSTYSTYEGQPASGPSAMLAATAQGTP